MGHVITSKNVLWLFWNKLINISPNDCNRSADVLCDQLLPKNRIFQTHWCVGFQRKNITMFWRSFLIGPTISDFFNFLMLDFLAMTVNHERLYLLHQHVFSFIYMNWGPSIDRSWLFEGNKQRGILAPRQKPWTAE